MKLFSVIFHACVAATAITSVDAFSVANNPTRSAIRRSATAAAASSPLFASSRASAASRRKRTLLRALGRRNRNNDAPENEPEKDDGQQQAAADPLVKETSLLLRRLSWLSWWAQLILTTVSSVTLVFARNVMKRAAAGGVAPVDAISLPNFLLVGSSLVLSFLSIFWAWATRRLARRLIRKPTTRFQAASMLRKDITIGVTLNVVGMFLTLLGAEQIVGALAIKVLTTSTRGISLVTADTNSFLQPLDILIVQANTNTLFSHFVSLAALLYLTRQVDKLDPPTPEPQQ